MGHVTAAGHTFQSQVREDSETHQEVLDLGPQHLELHQAQFVAAVFLWRQFRSFWHTDLPHSRKSLTPNRHVPHQKIYVAPGWPAAS